MDTQRDSWQIQAHKVRMAAGGRLVIPAEVRQEMGIKEGDELLLIRDAGSLRLSTVEQRVREIQALAASLVKTDDSFVDEVVRRREEAAEEERESRSRNNKSK